MIDIDLIRKDPEQLRASVRRRGGNESSVDALIALDNEWREATERVDALRKKQKELSANRNIEAAKVNKEEIKKEEVLLNEVASARQTAWRLLPNILADDVPDGKDDSENVVLRKWGSVPPVVFPPKDHLALGEALGIIDMAKAAEISGARFYYLKGDAALLEFALVTHAMRRLTNREWLRPIAERAGVSDKPFIPVVPPVIIKPETYIRMARLTPGVDEDERYYLPQDNQYLVGSAEHSLGPLHMDETLPADSAPIRYVGFSTCFRREAGSYGKDTRGMIRVHQFDKVEMESFTTSALGIAEQNFFVGIQEALLQELGIPHEVIAVCTGDMGSPDARQLDINCWLPAQQTYRETHSADYMADFQARRLGTRLKTAAGNEFAHMNDGTVFAISRMVVAILENFQNEDGSVTIPEVLRDFMGKDTIAA
ncbi:MAG: serine--tRNA ligase [Patescibacteria group bacterium]|jgi:seryl-tRNA synthetase